jgi:hypothetical protein
MSAPDGFQVLATHACSRPEKQLTLREGIDLVCGAVRFARENKIRRLLVDTTKLTGFAPPTTSDRYVLGERLAAEAMAMVKLALLARRELIDPGRFGVIVARNRGLWADVFDQEADALAWLLEADAR